MIKFKAISIIVLKVDGLPDTGLESYYAYSAHPKFAFPTYHVH